MSLLKILHQEDINFLLTNRIPRRLATRWIGWLSKIENPLVARASISISAMPGSNPSGACMPASRGR
jgi:hypothetical protein